MNRPASTAPTTSSLRLVLPDAEFRQVADWPLHHVTDRCDDVRPGGIFVAIRGQYHDGTRDVPSALARGAGLIVTEQALDNTTIPQCLVRHSRVAFGHLCAALFAQAHGTLSVVGVTGTNGKSTSAWLTRSILESTGRRCGLLGTIEYYDGRETQPATLTTPDPRVLWDWLTRMKVHGCDAAAVELSSHALHQDRVAGLSLSAAIVTNLTHDHLDYHGTWEAYRASKARILELVQPGGLVVLNHDDPAVWSFRDRVPAQARSLSFGLTTKADLSASLRSADLSGTTVLLESPWGRRECRIPMPGLHNVANALGVLAAVTELGTGLDAAITSLEQFSGVPGRLESIREAQAFAVLVDYAHTDDALRRTLQTLRPLTAGRLICVFGAGGDRDSTKRPKLGAAAEVADEVIITSDNPRSEPPERIAADIAAGMVRSPRIELDRARAITEALQQAQPGDCVLIAGKGHEREQVIGAHRLPFDDRLVTRRVLQQLAQSHGGRQKIPA